MENPLSESEEKVLEGCQRDVGHLLSPEARAKISASKIARRDRLGYVNSPETRAKTSAIIKEMWKDPAYRERVRQARWGKRDA